MKYNVFGVPTDHDEDCPAACCEECHESLGCDRKCGFDMEMRDGQEVKNQA